VFFLSGDFRQTLPVVPHGGRGLIVESCIKRNSLWPLVKQFRLTKNLRVDRGEDDFAAYLLNVGDGFLPKDSKDSWPFAAEIVSDLRGLSCPIDFVYENLESDILDGKIVDKAILAPRNIDCVEINKKVLNLLKGEAELYVSFDRVISDSPRAQLDFPVEYLNTLEVSGLPAHSLILKKKAIVMLMRNLHIASGLVNGTRLEVLDMLRHTIECKVLSGSGKGRQVLIPRISLSPSTTMLPVPFSRCQFPLALAFAMTINKSQGQTLSTVAVSFRKPVFGHGQLYVALSRARSFHNVKIFIQEGPQQRVLENGNIYTKNVVYQEVL